MGTVRIYKVAELLGTTSQEVTALLKRDHGIDLKSASSTIEEVVARQFVERLARQRNISLPGGDIFADTPAVKGKKGGTPAKKAEPARPVAPPLPPPRLVKTVKPAVTVTLPSSEPETVREIESEPEPASEPEPILQVEPEPEPIEVSVVEQPAPHPLPAVAAMATSPVAERSVEAPPAPEPSVSEPPAAAGRRGRAGSSTGPSNRAWSPGAANAPTAYRRAATDDADGSAADRDAERTSSDPEASAAETGRPSGDTHGLDSPAPPDNRQLRVPVPRRRRRRGLGFRHGRRPRIPASRGHRRHLAGLDRYRRSLSDRRSRGCLPARDSIRNGQASTVHRTGRRSRPGPGRGAMLPVLWFRRRPSRRRSRAASRSPKG